MNYHSVDKVAANDGACNADRPDGATTNSNWRPTDGSQVLPVTAHPAEPADYEKYPGAKPVAASSPRADDGCDRRFGPWDEDVYAQRCMDHHSVDKIAASDVAPDGACKADRPAGATPNSNGHPIDCSQVLPVTAHPLTEPAEYEQYLGAAPVMAQPARR